MQPSVRQVLVAVVHIYRKLWLLPVLSAGVVIRRLLAAAKQEQSRTCPEGQNLTLQLGLSASRTSFTRSIACHSRAEDGCDCPVQQARQLSGGQWRISTSVSLTLRMFASFSSNLEVILAAVFETGLSYGCDFVWEFGTSPAWLAGESLGPGKGLRRRPGRCVRGLMAWLLTKTLQDPMHPHYICTHTSMSTTKVHSENRRKYLDRSWANWANLQNAWVG